MKRCLTVIFILVLLAANAQKTSMSVGTQIPLKYDLGIEYKFLPKFSGNLHVGVLTKPYDKAILGIIQAFGVEQGYIDMISNAFKVGLVSDLSVRFHHRNNYFGIYGQEIHLFAQDTPSELVENFLGVELESYKKTKFETAKDVQVSLQSDLFQLGLLYGRRIPLKNPRQEIRLEFSVSKNISSKSVMKVNDEENSRLSSLIDDELKPIYFDYTYIPSINIYFNYKL